MKIFTRAEIIPAGKKPVFMLWPLLGMKEEQTDGPDFGRFEKLLAEGKNIFSLTTKEKCDVFVLSFEYDPDKRYAQIIRDFAEEALEYKKPLIVFYNSDFSDVIDLPNAVIFRTSCLRSEKQENEFGYPGWSVDFQEKFGGGKFMPLPKTAKAEICYCGYVDYLDFAGKLKYAIKRRRRKIPEMFRIGPELRGKAVRRLQADSRIEKNIIMRDGFWAAGENDKNKARKIYAENLLNSPYALVIRGAGNFSYRLYEVLSCGRIPVFINTDCLLPFDDFIDWKKHVLWIEETEINHIAEKLVNFHNNISPEEFSALQERNMKLYEEWISPLGFFKNILIYFPNSKFEI